MKPFKMYQSKDGLYYYTVGTKGVLATSETFVREENAVISCIRLMNCILGYKRFNPLRRKVQIDFMEKYIADKIK